VRALLVGFGNVGRRLAEILADRRAHPGLAALDLSVVGITTGSHGALADPSGLDLGRALAAYHADAGFTDAHRDFAPLDTAAAIGTIECDVVIELSPLSVAGRGEPAISHVRLALERGRHVITANKGPVAWAYPELSALARERGRRFLHEATVMDGAPVFNLARCCLSGNAILRIDGVLNSTTNVVLCAMERGEAFDEAVVEAQRLGVAEADPRHDLDGWDAAVKLAVLANALMSGSLSPEGVERECVTAGLRERVERARADGKRIKMVCEVFREGGAVRGRVAARELSADHPFARVEGTASIIRFSTDILGTLLVAEDAPDLSTTAYGVIADLFALLDA
jgi:homoserine dehydrogenase